MAKTIAKKNTGAQAFRKPCGSRPSRPARWPSWKMSRATPNAAPTASRLVTTPTAARIGACSATSSSRKPSARTTPMTSGVLAVSAASRSWFSATEPPTSAPCGEVGAQAVDGGADGLVGRVVLGDDLDHARCRRGRASAGMTWATPGVGLGDGGDLRGVGLGGDDLQRAGRALAERVLHLGVGDARAVALGHDLDRRHAGLQPEHGDAQRDERRRRRRRRRRAAGATGARPRRRSAASGARRSAPTAATACPRAGRAWPARRAAASASPRG